MAQHDYDIANASGASVRADLNAMADAMVSNNSGGTEPTTKFSYMWWADTTTGLMKQRNGANNAWLTRGSLTSAVVPAFESIGIDDNATSTAVTVDSSGNVLVGTTSGLTSGNVLYARGFPFVSKSTQVAIGPVKSDQVVFQGVGARTFMTAVMFGDDSWVFFQVCGSGMQDTNIDVGDITSGASDILTTFSYQTD